MVSFWAVSASATESSAPSRCARFSVKRLCSQSAPFASATKDLILPFTARLGTIVFELMRAPCKLKPSTSALPSRSGQKATSRCNCSAESTVSRCTSCATIPCTFKLRNGVSLTSSIFMVNPIDSSKEAETRSTAHRCTGGR